MDNNNDCKDKNQEINNERNKLLISKFLSKSGLRKYSHKEYSILKKNIITKLEELRNSNKIG